MKLRHLTIATLLTATPIALAESTPAAAATCSVIQNRTRNPDIATFYFTGSGACTAHIRCYYYTNGPWLHRWQSRTAPATFTLPCTSTYPLMQSAWITNDGPF